MQRQQKDHLKERKRKKEKTVKELAYKNRSNTGREAAETKLKQGNDRNK